MSTSAAKTGSDHHGPGHYSDDYCWWWDEADQHWHRLSDETETLEIVLEELGDRSWVDGVLTTLDSGSGAGSCRFVGLVRAGGPHPIDRVDGGTFTPPAVIDGGVPPVEMWPFGMTQELDVLRERLAADGWVPLGHGNRSWSSTYFRPRLEPDERSVAESPS